VGAAQQKSVKLPGPVNIVGVRALSREEAEILLAADSRADAEIAHEITLLHIALGGRVQGPKGKRTASEADFIAN
jgi:hypothetical protein